MAKHVVLQDWSGEIGSLPAGEILDDASHNVELLRKAGVAHVPFEDGMQPFIDVFLQVSRGHNPNVQLLPILRAAGFVGGGGGGGVVSVRDVDNSDGVDVGGTLYFVPEDSDLGGIISFDAYTVAPRVLTLPPSLAVGSSLTVRHASILAPTSDPVGLGGMNDDGSVSIVLVPSGGLYAGLPFHQTVKITKVGSVDLGGGTIYHMWNLDSGNGFLVSSAVGARFDVTIQDDTGGDFIMGTSAYGLAQLCGNIATVTLNFNWQVVTPGATLSFTMGGIPYLSNGSMQMTATEQDFSNTEFPLFNIGWTGSGPDTVIIQSPTPLTTNGSCCVQGTFETS